MNDTNVVYHGTVAKKQREHVLSEYDVSLVPLSTYIRGAVPSKIFELMPLGLPILFCGSGEAAEIINDF